MATIWGIIPAAGIGSRMQSDRPKQYLPLQNKLIIEHAIDCLLPAVSSIAIPLADGDSWWRFPNNPALLQCDGGTERVHSVVKALHCLRSAGANDDDWVLVHDAARPLLPRKDLNKILAHINSGSSMPAILAAPMADTVKRSADGTMVDSTVDRSQLWRALTPQAAPIGMLRDAIVSALASGATVTDESSALELAGYSPVIISADPRNLKITLPSDLLIAEALIQAQANHD